MPNFIYTKALVLHALIALKLCIENRTRKETNEVKFWKLELVFKNSSSKLGLAKRASFPRENSTEVFRKKKLFPQVN